MLEQQLVNGLSLGCVYALFALGFTLVFGVLGVINLSHGAIFMVGAYAAERAIATFEFGIFPAIIVAFFVSGLMGLLIDVLVLRRLRLRQAPHLIPMVATIGVGIVLNSAAQGMFGAQNRRYPEGAVSQGVYFVGDIQITVVELGIMLASAALMVTLFWTLRGSQLGRALRAVAESPRAAYLVGINVEKMFFIASFVAAALGGVAGVLIALYSNAVYPLMGQPMLHKGIAVIILGGMGDIRGAMLGGLFLGFAEVLSVAYIGSTSRDAVAFGLLFLVLLLRPTGIFGRGMQRKV